MAVVQMLSQEPGTSVDYSIDWTLRIPSGETMTGVTWASATPATATVNEGTTGAAIAVARVTAVSGAGSSATTLITCTATFSDATIDAWTFQVSIAYGA